MISEAKSATRNHGKSLRKSFIRKLRRCVPPHLGPLPQGGDGRPYGPRFSLRIGNFSCCPPFADEAEQVLTKLYNQPERDQGAREVGSQPTRIVHDLQDGNFVRELVVILIKASLIIGFAVIPKRVVHEDL